MRRGNLEKASSGGIKILPDPGGLLDVPNFNGEYCLPENVRGVFIRGRFYRLDDAPYRALRILEAAPGRSLNFRDFVRRYVGQERGRRELSNGYLNSKASSLVAHFKNAFKKLGVPLRLFRLEGMMKVEIVNETAATKPRPNGPDKARVPGYNDIFCLDGQGTGAFIGGRYFKLARAVYSTLEALRGTPGKLTAGLDFLSRRWKTPLKNWTKYVRSKARNLRVAANRFFSLNGVPLKIQNAGDDFYFETTANETAA